MIKALNILKLVNHRSQDLRSRRGFDSFRVKDDSKALALAAAACSYSFAFLRRFLQYVTSLTEPDHRTLSNLDFHYQMMDNFSSALAKYHRRTCVILVTTYSALS